MLAGQKKDSDAKATIEDEYYIFIATSKKDGHKEKILCGMGAARDFLKLLGHSGLPLFNPLKEDNTNSSINNSKSSRVVKDNDWNPVAKQLYNAIMWLIVLWDAKIDTALFDFRDDVVKFKKVIPFDWKIGRVNTAIKNGGNDKKLTEIIDGYRKYNDFKDSLCEFDLLESCISEMVDGNGDKLESFF